MTLNARFKVVVLLSELLNTAISDRQKMLPSDSGATLDLSLHIAEAETMRQATPFLQRIDAQRERDRKRLQDYYRALQRKSSTPNKRAKTVPTAEEIESRQKAVKLEQQRKLSELDERYLFSAVLRPIVLAEFRIPAVAIDVEIQRKAEKRIFRVYWNAMLKKMEPMSCSRCLRTSFNFWFTNDTVDRLCSACHG